VKATSLARRDHSDADFIAEENRWLRAIIFARTQWFPPEWDISGGAESHILGALIDARGILSHEQIATAIWMDNDSPDLWRALIGVRISMLRQKLRPFGIKIVSQAKTGYEIVPTGKKITADWLASKVVTPIVGIVPARKIVTARAARERRRCARREMAAGLRRNHGETA
jgi:hypothetical protein